MATNYTLNNGLQDVRTLNKIVGQEIPAVAQTIITGASSDVTAAITAILATEGANGDGVGAEVQVTNGKWSSDGNGILTDAVQAHTVSIADVNGRTIKALVGGQDFSVYGRITEAGGVYTLSYFYRDGAGVETSAILAAQDILFSFVYRFQLWHSNPRYDTVARLKFVGIDGGGNNIYEELLTVVTADTVPDITKTPADHIKLSFGGHELSTLTGGFTIVDKTITWGGLYPLEVGDELVATYATPE